MNKHHAIYMRVRTKRQDTASQEPELKRLAESHEGDTCWYHDTFTGTSMDRPGFRKLIKDMETGQVDTLVVWRLLDATKYIIGRLDPNCISSARTADQAALRAESEALLERVINEFGGIPLVPKWAKVKPDGRTLADSARTKLEAMRSLAVGWVAPEIESQDIDGKPMKLSDYRGKVVVLCFWGTWCGPCMAMVPFEKALVERLKGRPFVLLGINSDSDREKLKSVMAEKGMTWRSWWDRGRTGGPIATRWDVHAWPAIIVLDGKGVIRFKGLPHHVAKPLDDAVDSLLEEMKR